MVAPKMVAPKIRSPRTGKTLVAAGILALVVGTAGPAFGEPGNGNGAANGGGAPAASAAPAAGGGGGASAGDAGGGGANSGGANSGGANSGGANSGGAGNAWGQNGGNPNGGGSTDTRGNRDGSLVTEDNDDNDGGTPNNVVDEGDNRHPSGKDKSVERGKSGNQGKSPSDPDGMSNGGPDKPGGSGGVDLADQDGNNGCGNDDDFEDDNNGNCGGRRRARPRSSEPERRVTVNDFTPAPQPSGDAGGSAVLSGSVAPAPAPAVVTFGLPAESGSTFRPGRVVPRLEVAAAPAVRVTDTPRAEVLGTSFVREPVFAYTGTGVNRLLGFAGFALVLGGLMVLIAGHKQGATTA